MGKSGGRLKVSGAAAATPLASLNNGAGLKRREGALRLAQRATDDRAGVVMSRVNSVGERGTNHEEWERAANGEGC